MTHTVDTLMALADRYRDLKVGEGTAQTRSALRAALTEALAQPVKPIAQRVQDLVERLGGIEYLESRSAQSVREPLTDVEISEIVEYLPENSDEQIQDDPVKFIRDLIRSIERAHGIGGDK